MGETAPEDKVSIEREVFVSTAIIVKRSKKIMMISKRFAYKLFWTKYLYWNLFLVPMYAKKTFWPLSQLFSDANFEASSES